MGLIGPKKIRCIKLAIKKNLKIYLPHFSWIEVHIRIVDSSGKRCVWRLCIRIAWMAIYCWISALVSAFCDTINRAFIGAWYHGFCISIFFCNEIKIIKFRNRARICCGFNRILSIKNPSESLNNNSRLFLSIYLVISPFTHAQCSSVLLKLLIRIKWNASQDAQ